MQASGKEHVFGSRKCLAQNIRVVKCLHVSENIKTKLLIHLSYEGDGKNPEYKYEKRNERNRFVF